MLDSLRALGQHLFWADRRLVEALRSLPETPTEALRELAHVVGTEENWLARIQERDHQAEIWPDVDVDELATLLDETHDRLSSYFDSLSDDELERSVRYVNSAGEAFENTVQEILLHLLLHGQYHRGKVNLLLRQSDVEPVWGDYIAFLRGAPAATEATALPRNSVGRGTNS